MINDMHMYVDRSQEAQDEVHEDDIWTIEVNFLGCEPRRYVMSVNSDRTPLQLAQDFRAFADTLEYGIEGNWH